MALEDEQHLLGEVQGRQLSGHENFVLQKHKEQLSLFFIFPFSKRYECSDLPEEWLDDSYVSESFRVSSGLGSFQDLPQSVPLKLFVEVCGRTLCSSDWSGACYTDHTGPKPRPLPASAFHTSWLQA